MAYSYIQVQTKTNTKSRLTLYYKNIFQLSLLNLIRIFAN